MVTAEKEDGDGGRFRLEELRAAQQSPTTGFGVGLPEFKPKGSCHLFSVETLKMNLTP